MMRMITTANMPRFADVMEDVWSFRHRHFVDRFGWRALTKPDGREIDQFDTDGAVHLPLVLDGKVTGYTRLLRTDRPHLLSDVYPELMDGAPWPRGDDILEWTRCVAEPGVTNPEGVSANFLVFAGVAEAFVALGLRGVIVQTHPKLVTRLLETGWQVRPLNVPRIYDGAPLAVIFAHATAETVAISRAQFGLDGPVLTVDSDMPHPTRPDARVEMHPGWGATYSRTADSTDSPRHGGKGINSGRKQG
ncbi:acyl-homoserine-lactone synthase [Jiella sonneratiae]|uniref:Acyl-homoserine-lactone synthase n=1 Tax=Jiella sonneratiae TaxID=2816856 RepID=A0ABS3IYU2_9HYPH|nr:acyl-homoserine-lactone synthase [Jiella sonneratiae]MBO0902577.1 GNAT family N-acetyltransferase [Jiella sonneratiae]